MIQDKETRENRQHSTTFIPYSHYECRIPDDFVSVTMHWHSEFEINYIVCGRGEFICGDEKFTGEAGDIVVIPPNMLHAAYSSDNNPLIYHAFVFNANMLGSSSNDRCTNDCIRPIINGNIQIKSHISPDMPAYEAILASTRSVFACINDNSSLGDLLLKSELMRLFWLLESNRDIVCEKNNKVSYSDIIRPALEFMASNYQLDITVDMLADMVHLSKSYFMNCFKKAVGIGAIEHLTQLRISAACDALSSTDMMISDISINCGYTNLSNFNRQFMKLMGCSPKQYRKYATKDLQ